jgi:diguanylate cyclase (GGDEF)-like protein
MRMEILDPATSASPEPNAYSGGPPSADAMSAVDRYVESELTDLFGPQMWARLLKAESARCARYKRTSTVVLASMAGLNELATTWGEDTAGQAIVTVARLLGKSCRDSDFVGWTQRWRFGVILTETDEIAAINYVERVRDRVGRDLGMVGEYVRMGFGWASPTASTNLAASLAKAEKRLLADLT